MEIRIRCEIGAIENGHTQGLASYLRNDDILYFISAVEADENLRWDSWNVLSCSLTVGPAETSPVGDEHICTGGKGEREE
jgi:hypothetical protein